MPTNYFNNDLYIFIMIIDILFIIFFVLNIIIELLQRSLDETEFRLEILEQIKDVDDAFKKNNNFEFYKTNTDETETYLFISNDQKFAYHEFADEQSRITMIFSSLEDTMVSLIIHIDLNSKKLIRVRSTTDMNYFISKFNEFGINMDTLQQMHTLPMLVKRKFELSDKLTSELLSKMRSDLKSFRKMMSE